MGNNDDGQLGINSLTMPTLHRGVLQHLNDGIDRKSNARPRSLYQPCQTQYIPRGTGIEPQNCTGYRYPHAGTQRPEWKSSASDSDVSIYNAEFTSLQRQLYDISQVSVGGENLFAQYATDAYGNQTFTDAVFGTKSEPKSGSHL